MPLLVLLVVVDLVVPEERLVAIAPKEVLGADVLVGVLGLLLHGRLVGFVLPVSVPPHLTIDSSHEQAWHGKIDGELPPEFTALGGMLLDAGTLAVEFVVLGSDELLGGLAAVHAAAQRRTDGGHTLAGAEEGALGKHGGVWARADRADRKSVV